MKTFLLVLIFIVLSVYYFVPNEVKNNYTERAWLKFRFNKLSKDIEEWKVRVLEFNETWKTEFVSDIQFWKIIEDLSWWPKHYVSCFDNKSFNYFNWKHQLHRIILEKNSTIQIKLIDNTENKDLSIYAYKVKPAQNLLPPNIEYVHACSSKKSTDTDKVIEIKWDTIRSEIVIWVVWSNSLNEWKYELYLEQK